jgi:hydrogenase expression/formation protein HypE
MTTKKNYLRPIDFKHGHIDMTHGAGGRAAAQLIDELFAKAFDNEFLRQGHDGALLPLPREGRLVMATDGHVISPLFFPGGDIGCLSVHGTVNDVAMSGAKPLYSGSQLHHRRRLCAGGFKTYRRIHGCGCA